MRVARAGVDAVGKDPGVDEAGMVVCITYGARNGFGGMSCDHTVFLDGVLPRILQTPPPDRARLWTSQNNHALALRYGEIAESLPSLVHIAPPDTGSNSSTQHSSAISGC